MRALIVKNSFANAQSYLRIIERFVEELDKKGTEVDVIDASSFPVIINEANRLSDKYDYAIYLDKDRYLSNLLESSGLRLFNKAKSIEVCDDKMMTHIELAKFKIPQPKTIPGVLCYVNDAKYSKESLDIVEEELGYPLVFKESYGSLGKGVHLVSNRKELDKLANKYIGIPHLFQELIKTSYGKDYRVIVIGHKVVASMKRVSATDFRSNIELGGKASKCVLPDEYKRLAIKVSKVLNLDYCGVDILIGKNNKPIICEVNSNAFFNGIESITKVNIAKTYVDYIEKTIKKEGNRYEK